MTETVFPGNARSDEQRAVLEQILAEGGCPFCGDNLFRHHKKPIIEGTAYWLATENQWPYKGTTKHILVICKRHVENLSDLTLEEGQDLFPFLQHLCKKLGIESGGIAMRFGDPSLSGASVRHLHTQIVVPADEETVRIKIGK